MTTARSPADAAGGLPIDFLYTNIGRGHPHYLDGIIECLPPQLLGRVSDVFEAATGLGGPAWRLVRAAYRLAGRRAVLARWYSRARSQASYDRGWIMQTVLGTGLRRRYVRSPAPLVVAHPLLTAVLRDKPNLIYQHGEVAAPRESVVVGRHMTIVPIAYTADAMRAAGVASERLFVSGLCVEPALVSQSHRAYGRRIGRLESSEPLCGAFFSSGAEPREHIERIVDAALSVVTGGGRALIFARAAGALSTRATSVFARAGLDFGVMSVPGEPVPPPPSAVLCTYDRRAYLNALTASTFEEFDYFVAPAHERTGWALGLGLPMFIVEPPIGSFAPLNREFLIRCEVASVLPDPPDALRFGALVDRLRASGQLRAMSEAGWCRFDIHGFANIARMLSAWP